MLSAHAPYEHYPQAIKETAREIGAVARVAGGVPAMCDGITQGRAGMELSLFSRDVIAMSTAIALSHDVFDAALMLGVCDKIVPGLVAGALTFGHLPIGVRARRADGDGPLERREGRGAKGFRRRPRRARGAAGLRGRVLPLAGTCTFYGTANSNQLLMDVMGLHLPGAAFVHPDEPERAALTDAATRRVAEIAASGRALRHRPRRRRAGRRQRRRGPAGDRRLDQPHDAPGRRWLRLPASTSRGTTSTTCRPSCRCSRGSTPTAPPT